MMQRTLTFGAVAGVFVLVHSKEAPTDPEWEAWMNFWAEQTYRQAGRMRQLVVTAGGAPTAAQRQRMAERFRVEQSRWVELWASRGSHPPEQARVAVVTESLFVRGVVNALEALRRDGWFVGKVYRALVHPGAGAPGYRAFSATEMARALGWLDVPAETGVELLRNVEELRTELRTSNELRADHGYRYP